MTPAQAAKRTELIESAKAKAENSRASRTADKQGVTDVLVLACGCWNFVHLGRCIHLA